MNQKILKVILPPGYKSYPVQWYCRNKKQLVQVYTQSNPGPNGEIALPDPSQGWICDCGSWVLNEDHLHAILAYNSYKIDYNEFPYSIFKLTLEERKNCIQFDPINPYEHPNVRCEKCKSTNHESHSINGFWVCTHCYPEAFKYCNCHW